MKHHTLISAYPQAIAKTPRQFGVNVEVQDYHDTTNLWDWIADSGVSIVRDFHPEVNLRRAQLPAGTWGTIASQQDFEDWRQRVVANPDEGPIAWSAYRFNETVKWLGNPDGIAGSLQKIEVECLYSLGYASGFFERPLLKQIDFVGHPTDEDIDWEAAASAYDYYFAYIYHFTQQFGARQFLMINEPENRHGWWHLPEDIKNKSWGEVYWEDPNGALSQRMGAILGAQYAVCTRIARMALNDVRKLLNASEMFLYGPTTVFWDPLWKLAEPWLDGLDVHHYHHKPETYSQLWPTVVGHSKGKPGLITEFNRYSGGMTLDKGPFLPQTAVETANILMEIAGLSQTNDPDLAIACFYLLHFPSTHRNHKHLLYGDMNVIDWTGDGPLWDKGDEWYPSADELQIRHMTPSYHAFRMIARAVCGDSTWPILRYGLDNPSSSGPADIHDQLKIVIVD